MTAIFETSHELEVSALVAAARNGESSAMTELFHRFEGMVMSIALARIRDREDAEDVCQETFSRAFRKLDQLQTDAAFAGWLKRIALNLALNYASRRRQLVSVDHEILDSMIADNETATAGAQELIRGEEVAKLREGLTRLRDLDRETLVAFYLEGQSLLDMSNRFNSPLGTIKRRLHDARKRLASECQKLV
jgi:RNA polymerase sigma-70 factor (ECF subfamily)